MKVWNLKPEQITGFLKRAIRNPEGTPAGDSFGQKVALSVDGRRVAIAAPSDDTGASSAGSVFVFNAETGALISTLRNPEATANDFFGSQLSISGDGSRVAVGVQNEANPIAGAGTAYIFNAITGAVVATIRNPSGETYSYFGAAVALSGDGTVVAVAAPSRDQSATDSGVVYILNASTGAAIVTIPNPEPGNYDFFGTYVSLSYNGLRVAVNSYEDDTGASNAGSVFVFNASTGALVSTIRNPEATIDDRFGEVSLSSDGARVAVGVGGDDYGDSNAGSVYIYNATTSTGTLTATIRNPSPAASDFFGTISLSADGKWIAVGATGDDTGESGAGIAYIFNAETGALVRTITNPETTAGDSFGRVSISGDGSRIAIASPYDDSGAADAGSVYIF